MTGRTLLRIAASIVLMMVVWLFWSGYLKPLLVTLGLVSCLVVAVLSWRMGNLEREIAWQQHLLRFPHYWLWLGAEVVRSNLAVARVILAPRLALRPRLITVDAGALDEFGRALLGNSITLTPGTLTLADDAGRLHVHCLTPEGAEALIEGEMTRRVAALTKA
jgi:multicomponent Na+:H+ antiporter subunit E